MATIVNTITQSTPSSSPAEGTQKQNFDSSRIDFLTGVHLNFDSGRLDNLHADSANFTTLTASNFTLTSLNVDSGNITNLTTNTLNPATLTTPALSADSAHITKLTATDITATQLNISVGTTFAFSGIFQKLSVDSSNITTLTTQNLSRVPAQAIVAGKYGQIGTAGKLSKAAVITVYTSGFIEKIESKPVAGVQSVAFDSATFNFTINTTDSGSTPVVKMAHTRKPGLDASASFYGTSSKVPTIKINQYGHVDSIALLDISAISSVTWDSATSTLNLAQVDGTTVGDIINGWGDNEKIYFGAGQDLEIYHDTTNSVIKDNGAGSLVLASDNVAIQNVGQTETMATFQQDAGTALFFDNAQKLTTTTAGIQVTGTSTATGGFVTGGHILPTTDDAVDLGSTTKKFRDLHLSGGTLKIGTIQLKDSSQGLRVEKIVDNKRAPITFREINVDSAKVTGNITAGTFTGDGNAITNLSSTEVRSHFSGGTGVTITGGSIAIGQAVATTSDVTFNDLVVDGNLTVNGDTTTLNTATLSVEDLNITVAKNATNSTQADGAGLTVAGANANFTYSTTGDRFNMNKNLAATGFIGNVTGQVSDISNHNTDALSEGTTNKYFSNTLARQAISGDKGITYSSGTGKIDVDSSNIIGFTRESITGNKGLSYNNTTGELNLDSSNVKGMFSGTNNIVFSNGEISTNISSADLSTDSTNLSTTSSNQVVSSISALTHRSVKYLVQVGVNASNKFQTSEINVIHHGGSAFMTEYGRVGNTDDNLATFDADVNTNNLRLLATPANANTIIKVFKTAFKI